MNRWLRLSASMLAASARAASARAASALAASALAAVGVIGVCLPAAAAEAERGQALYELRCGGCHETSVHQRASRSAQTFEQIREAVARWQREVGADWREDETDAVTWHLNERYYKLPCPTTVCGTPRASSSAVR